MCKYCDSLEEPICGDCAADLAELKSERVQKAMDDFFEEHGYY